MQIDVPARRRSVIRLTPLIDVVFILLVFFMLASSFLDWRAFEIAVPGTPSESAGDSDPVVVAVTADGGFEVGGRGVEAGELARAVEDARASADERPVVLRPADDAPVAATVEAFDRLRAGGIERISIGGGGS